MVKIETVVFSCEKDSPESVLFFIRTFFITANIWGKDFWRRYGFREYFQMSAKLFLGKDS